MAISLHSTPRLGSDISLSPEFAGEGEGKHLERQEFSTLSHSISQYPPLTPDIHPQGTPRYPCDDEGALGQGLVALSLSDPDSSDMSDGSEDSDNMSDMSDMSDRDTTSASMVDGIRQHGPSPHNTIGDSSRGPTGLKRSASGSGGDPSNCGGDDNGDGGEAGDGDETDDDDDENNGGGKRVKIGEEVTEQQSKTEPHNCPFRKRYKDEYNFRVQPCCAAKFMNFNSVKRHVREKHKASSEEFERLTERKFEKKVDCWEKLWKLLFPGDDVMPRDFEELGMVELHEARDILTATLEPMENAEVEMHVSKVNWKASHRAIWREIYNQALHVAAEKGNQKYKQVESNVLREMLQTTKEPSKSSGTTNTGVKKGKKKRKETRDVKLHNLAPAPPSPTAHGQQDGLAAVTAATFVMGTPGLPLMPDATSQLPQSSLGYPDLAYQNQYYGPGGFFPGNNGDGQGNDYSR